MFPGVTAKVPATSTAASVVAATRSGCGAPKASAIDAAAPSREKAPREIQRTTRPSWRRLRSRSAAPPVAAATAIATGVEIGRNAGPRPTATIGPTTRSLAAAVVATVVATPTAPAARP
jgi:hypothetical protein